ncbi:MAG: nitroreductase family deazaflavin-dependent oxidoreductase [Chloroflexi bacterium]|nr:MAG: nitroreductase family deazaflavin-dependent oxidoreductase [Chloroflexota bacterium]TMF57366.1 MAG: nitroreductase family deazaflavin-dependent oxidoreductase [Chloroflexota bacterium]
MANARPGGWNDSIIAQFRANGGQMTSGPFTGRTLLLLTTKGAKTSVERTSPLVYSRDGERFVIVASKGGAPTHPAWYHNLRAHPEVTLEVGKEKFRARASVATAAERRRLYDKHAERMPAFWDYEKKTTRKIPVVVLERI